MHALLFRVRSIPKDTSLSKVCPKNTATAFVPPTLQDTLQEACPTTLGWMDWTKLSKS